MNRGLRLASGVALAATLLLAACGSDGTPAGGPASPGTAPIGAPSTDGTAPTTTLVPAWIDGEPDWRSDPSDGAEGELSYTSDAGGRAEDSVAAEAPIPVEPDGGIGDGAEPLLEPDTPSSEDPLRAGSVDDNSDYQGFLEYLARIDDLGIARRPLDPVARSIVTVTDESGRPVPGAVVQVTSADGQLATVRTTADGTARFHPAFYGMPTDGAFTYAVAGGDAEGSTVDAPAGQDVALLGAASAIGQPVPLDVLFLLDATGSMGDEIDRLKTTIDLIADRVAQLDPAPDVRFAMTLYRDLDDSFVTASHDFTGDVAAFRAALAEVVADGGGDYPEALDEGLADALAKPSWRDPATTVQLVFVVADAPPQVGRQVDVPYTDSVRAAIERGIKIFPVASSDSDDQAEVVFRQLAQATGAPFVFLSHGAAGASLGGSTDITSTDYEELALDELVVRLVAEELADLEGGGEVTVPTTTPPPTTNPDGQ